jgi:hypothetical protein
MPLDVRGQVLGYTVGVRRSGKTASADCQVKLGKKVQSIFLKHISKLISRSQFYLIVKLASIYNLIYEIVITTL